MLETPDSTFSLAFELPRKSPVQPVELGLDDAFQFDCHKGIACFNECCKHIDIALTPYDLLRLARRLGLTSRQFLARHTVPYEMDHHGLPGLKMAVKKGTAECQFLTDEGCGIYEDRPAACRYYALGSMAVRKKDSPAVEDIWFVVKEDHCLGHNEPCKQTVGEYRHQQGVDEYDEHNREWRDVVLKKRSSGPTVGRPSERSLDLFWMAGYDLDGFRAFVASPGFLQVFDLDVDTLERLRTSDTDLLRFAARFLKQVLFGEMTIPRKDEGVEGRLERLRGERNKATEQKLTGGYDVPVDD